MRWRKAHDRGTVAPQPVPAEDLAIARSYRSNSGWSCSARWSPWCCSSTSAKSSTTRRSRHRRTLIRATSRRGRWIRFMKFVETDSQLSHSSCDDQTTGTLEALLVTPARHSLVVLGGTSYGLFFHCLEDHLLAVPVVGSASSFSVGLSSLSVLVVALQPRSVSLHRLASWLPRSPSCSAVAPGRVCHGRAGGTCGRLFPVVGSPGMAG